MINSPRQLVLALTLSAISMAGCSKDVPESDGPTGGNHAGIAEPSNSSAMVKANLAGIEAKIDGIAAKIEKAASPALPPKPDYQARSS